jgi:hypothetical protein
MSVPPSGRLISIRWNGSKNYTSKYCSGICANLLRGSDTLKIMSHCHDAAHYQRKLKLQFFTSTGEQESQNMFLSPQRSSLVIQK